MKLKDIAHSRAGDKGNTANISLIVYDIKDYEYIRQNVTEELVKEHFSDITKKVSRYELPQIGALNFVLHDSLGGGVTMSTRIDKQGKTLSSRLLDIKL